MCIAECGRLPGFLRLLVVFVFIMSGCASGVVKGPVNTLEEARDVAIKKVYKGKLEKKAIFGSAELKKSGVMIGTWPTPEKIKVDKDAWFFFIDEAPGANWEHPAKFVLVEKKSGKVHIYPARTPPHEVSSMKPLNEAAKRQMKMMKESALTLRERVDKKAIKIKKQKKYAVLVSGGWNSGANYGRYWNDLSFIYKALKEKYSYTDDEIIVLYANGSHQPDEDLDGDGTDDVDYAATKINLTDVMKEVGDRISPAGKFFFYSTNHGGYESGHDAILYLWGETITDDEFGTLTEKIKSKQAIYVMEQCYSGGMMDDILQAQSYPCTKPRVCVMTAAKHDEVSWSADTEGAYDEYVYHWTSAVYGQNPDGTIVNADSDGDGAVSMKEAHEYAKEQDSRNENPLIGSCITQACGTSLFANLSFKEDCVSFNPATTEVKKINDRWKIVDGDHWIFDFGDNSAEANQSLGIIKNYKMDQACFVGRPDPSFQYLLVSGDSPAGGMAGEDCIGFNPVTAAAKEINGRWKVVDGTQWMFDFGDKKTEAQQTLQIIVKYRFNRSCFVGRPDASFIYMRK